MIQKNELCPCNSGQKAKKCCLSLCCELCLSSKEHLNAVSKGWVLKKSLIRQNGKCHLPLCPALMKFHPKTLVISGNGSVYWNDPEQPQQESNPWNLIQKCVDKIKLSPEGRGVGIPSKAENFLHWLVSVEKLTSYFSQYPPHDEKFKEIQKVIKIFRKLLGESFLGADIRLRSLCCFNCEKSHGIHPRDIKNCGFLTLNWDGSIRTLQNTIEMHGTHLLPETIVLPNQDFTYLLPSKGGGMNPGCESFALAHHWMADCKNIIIWGCQLNDYDAIISTILSTFSLKFAKGKIGLFISNPNLETRKKIETKLRDYLPLANFYKCLNDISFDRV